MGIFRSGLNVSAAFFAMAISPLTTVWNSPSEIPESAQKIWSVIYMPAVRSLIERRTVSVDDDRLRLASVLVLPSVQVLQDHLVHPPVVERANVRASGAARLEERGRERRTG